MSVAFAALCGDSGAWAQPCVSTSHAMVLCGEAHNLLVDKRAGVTMTVSSNGDRYRASGAYDQQNLFGRFDVAGKTVRCSPEAGDATCVQFDGLLHLGDDGSGFPPGTDATYAMTLVIDGDTVTGRYELGYLAGIGSPQNGTLDMKRCPPSGKGAVRKL